MASNGGRAGPEWQALRRWVIANFDTCHLCRRPVNKELSGRHPLGPTVDHLTPISKGGALLDRNNCRLAHRRCNTERGVQDLEPKPNPGPSRQWLST